MADLPFNPWKDYFDIWEKHTARYWDDVLRSPLFLEAIGRNLEMSLAWQRAALNGVEAVQKAWGLPTRSEQEFAQHQLNQLATRMQQLARRMEKLELAEE